MTRKFIVALALLSSTPALAAPDQSIRILDLTVNEPDGAAAVRIERVGADRNNVFSFSYTTLDGSAVAGQDYTAKSGTAQVAANQDFVLIPFSIINDTAVEQNECFTVKLTAGAGSRLYDGTGQVCIVSEDVAAPPPPPPPSSGVIAAEGDSISVKWGGNYTGMFEANHPGVTVHGFAVSGSQIGSMVQRFPAVTDVHPQVITGLIGANDFTWWDFPGPEAWVQRLIAYADSAHSIGAKFVAATILPQCGFSWDAKFNADRAVANNLIRAQVGVKFDALTDYAADPVMGPDAAACDRSLYSDGLHPTDPTVGPNSGQARLYAIYAPVVEAVLAGGSATAPAPAPAPAPINPTPALVANEPAPIPSNFDVASMLQPGWGTGAIPPSASPDVVGAFRFICGAGQIAYADPIVYPGQPGKGHLHQFFGNTLANAYSTYESLRKTGDSTCNNPLNRSGYWIPAMLNGKGSVVRPDYISVYYKRRPASDPRCQGLPAGQGLCKQFPRGIRFIFGADPMNPASPPLGAFYFNCDGTGATPGHYKNIREAIPFCPAGAKLGMVIQAPSCWDGKSLDTPDHRSHFHNGGYNPNDGQYQCPTTHPIVLTDFQIGAWYTVDADLPTWRLSSDMAGMEAGSSAHGDWFPAWDDTILTAWHTNCINKKLNCSGGELGDGRQIKPINGYTYKAEPRLVPVPAL